MASPVSPLAVPLPELPPIAGVRLGAAEAGIRYQGRTDLMMMEFAAGHHGRRGLHPQQCPGAPVDWCRAALKGGKARALVVNAGNANAFTGKAGRRGVRGDGRGGGRAGRLQPSEVFLASTGVIGEPLPHEKLIAALPGAACERCGADALGGRRARHHDHRHLPQGRDAHRADRRRRR